MKTGKVGQSSHTKNSISTDYKPFESEEKLDRIRSNTIDSKKEKTPKTPLQLQKESETELLNRVCEERYGHLEDSEQQLKSDSEPSSQSLSDYELHVPMETLEAFIRIVESNKNPFSRDPSDIAN